jgi:hypothetical protein
MRASNAWHDGAALGITSCSACLFDHGEYDVATMIYSVVPRPLADELYPRLVKHYEDEDNVTVIVDRRERDRRSRNGSAAARAAAGRPQRRVLRDRRRARVAGDLLPLVRVP